MPSIIKRIKNKLSKNNKEDTEEPQSTQKDTSNEESIPEDSSVEKWEYEGITNRFENRHSWTKGNETLSILYRKGAAHHAGFVIEVTRENRNATLVLSNGFIQTFHRAMILADLFMRDDKGNPAAFMHSDRIESNHGMGKSVRQDEWLEAHAHDYEFGVLDPDKTSSTK